jgi:hypothetical protein
VSDSDYKKELPDSPKHENNARKFTVSGMFKHYLDAKLIADFLM